MQLDPLKIKYANPIQTIRLVVEEEGGRALFGGLPAAVMRAGTIYATRLSIYEPALNRVISFAVFCCFTPFARSFDVLY